MVEVFITVLAIDTTGYWDSPFAFCLLSVVVAAGFAQGFGLGVRVAGVAVLCVGIPSHLEQTNFGIESLGRTGQWALELLLVAILAGYARRLFGEAEERHEQALDRVSQLAEANDLLVSLHRVAQSLPASLNLDQVAKSTIERLRSLIDCDVTALLLRDDVTGRWIVAASEGAVATRPLADETLPTPLRAATSSSVSSLVVSLAPGEGFGPTLVSRSGLYAPLRARGALVGLVALEHHDPGHYGRRELQLLDGFIDSAALALDNARWFARLRGMGADEERTRIARDMHDRIGQSLAYVAFELDRMTGQAEEPFKARSTACAARSARCWARCATPFPTCGPRSPTSGAWSTPSRPTSSGWRPAPTSSSTSATTATPACPSYRNGSCGGSPRRRSATSSATPGPATSASAGSATATRPSSRWPTTASASLPRRPAEPIPSASPGCRSGPTPSVPPCWWSPSPTSAPWSNAGSTRPSPRRHPPPPTPTPNHANAPARVASTLRAGT